MSLVSRNTHWAESHLLLTLRHPRGQKSYMYFKNHIYSEIDTEREKERRTEEVRNADV